MVNVAVLGKPAVEKESTDWISVAAPPPASSPVPVRRIGISGFAEVLIRVRYALRVPVAEGLKVNSKLQDVPGITGVELADALRTRSANLKVLFMSGYAERDSLRVLQAHEQFIPKPFLPDELFRQVNDFLRA